MIAARRPGWHLTCHVTLITLAIEDSATRSRPHTGQTGHSPGVLSISRIFWISSGENGTGVSCGMTESCAAAPVVTMVLRLEARDKLQLQEPNERI